MSDRRRKVKLPRRHQDEIGLICPVCGCRDFRVLYTRRYSSGLRRRRECRHCGKRITTFEKQQ